ncbi:MAG: TonB-dependent receptor [Acidobacteria bacterium]|nr:TonB-dependent receptor [Acidobacteriota bacterium]
MHYQKLPSRVRLVLLTMAILLLAAPLSFAQSATGGIRGSVTDPNGAAIPNATITAKNPATGLELKTTSNSEGLYSVPRILPGKFSITVEAQGFKKSEVTDIEVSLGKDTVIDVALQAGAISEVVNVQGGAEAALVEKDTVQISTTFQQKKVADLPINVPGAGLDRIALLSPGVTVGFGNVNGNGLTLSANGQRARSNNFTVRNPDVVGEIQIVTNNFSAEYGRNTGAVVNYVSRSGTNAYHGSAGWDHQDNSNFNSLTNIEKRRGDKEPAANLNNIFTYAVGGPVLKNKVFFYTTGYFRRNPQLLDLTTTSLAPTTAGIAALKAAYPNNAAIQYYADYSAFSLPLGNPTPRPDVAQSSITVGTTVVPMAAVRRLVPFNNRQDEYTVRSDANLTDKHRFWGRYFWQKSPNVNAGIGVDGWTYDNPALSKQIGGGWNWTITARLNNEFRFNYSKLFVLFGGGTTGGKGQIPEVEKIDQAFARLTTTFTAANGAAVLGVGPATNLPQGRNVESYQFSDNLAMTRGNHQMKLGADIRKLKNTAPFLPNVNGNFQFDNLTQFAANTPTTLTVALGPSTLKYDEVDQFYYFQDDWRFRPNITFNLGVRYENTGQPINLLNKVTVERESNTANAFWLQSLPLEARTNPKIPVDGNNWAPRLGLVYSPKFTEGILGKLLGSDKTTVRGGFGMAYDATFYNLMLNISTAAPTVFLTTVAGTFAAVPTASPTGDKVRAAAVASGQIAFNKFDPRFLNRTTINPNMRAPYVEQWSFGVQREIGRNVVEVRYVGNHSVGQFQTINQNPFIGNIVNGFSRTYYDPVSASNKTLALAGFPNAIPSSIKPLTAATCFDKPETPYNEGACLGRVYQAAAARERINGAQSTYHGLQTRFDGRFKSDIIYGMSYTYSHAIDNVSEVFQFNTGNSNPVAQNPLNLTSDERGNSGFDVRHSFTANLIWELPFGKGRRFLASSKKWVNLAVGGWQMNGTARVQNGVWFTPIHPTSANNPYEDTTFMNGFIGVAQMRPFNGNPKAALNSVAITDVDACIFYSLCGTQGGQPILRTSSSGYYLMSDLNKRDSAGNRIFTPVTPNDVRFIINGPGAAQKFGTPFGNVGRNTFRGDRIETVDFSVFKTFTITERVNFQYRLEMINALNHPIFGIPNSINVNNLNFFNFQENSGGRRVISMGLRLRF